MQPPSVAGLKQGHSVNFNLDYKGFLNIRGFTYCFHPFACLFKVRITLSWALEEAQAHIKSQVENRSVTAVTGENVQLPIGDHQVSP